MKPLADRLRVIAQKIEDAPATVEARRMPARHKLTQEEQQALKDAGFNPREFVASEDDDKRYPTSFSSFGSEVTVSVYPVEKSAGFFSRERGAPEEFMVHVRIGSRSLLTKEYKTRDDALESAHDFIVKIGKDIAHMTTGRL